MGSREENGAGPLCYLSVGAASRRDATRFRRSLGGSFLLQCLTVGLLLALPLLMPQPMGPTANFGVVPLLSTPLTSLELPSHTKAPARLQPLPERPEMSPQVARVIHFSKPMPPNHQLNEERAATPPEFDRKVPNAIHSLKIDLKNPRPPVETGVLSAANATLPALTKSPGKVQTGGFGDPNGVPAAGEQRKSVNIAQKGQLDLPPGPGLGNGTGGASGARGTILSAGFSSLPPTESGERGTGKRAGVTTGQFGDYAAETAAVARRGTVQSVLIQPVEVHFKPTPIYTEEARRLKIEGEVVLSVRFTADGRVQVLHVIRSLGHGLDEAARRAAEGILFEPETHNGQPVDSEGMVRIHFQLAY